MKVGKRLTIVATTLGAVVLLWGTAAQAGNPHFVDDQVKATVAGSTLTVDFKEAGLGDEAQVHVVLEATAACLNPGGDFPQAANKETFVAAGDFPVQNGKVDGALSVTATFQPHCSPPMTVVFGSATLTDTTNNLVVTLL